MAESAAGAIVSLLFVLKEIAPTDPIRKAGAAVLQALPTHPESCRRLAHVHLNARPFHAVQLCWRRAYEEACLHQVKRMVAQQHDFDPVKIVHLCDWAILMTGAPGRRAVIDEIFKVVDLSVDEGATRSAKRQRMNHDRNDPKPCSIVVSEEHEIPRVKALSLHAFEQHLARQRTPLVIQGAIEHWPALEKWQNPEHWLASTHGGHRLVPVELGAAYTDDDWGQKIMEFGQFMESYLLKNAAVKGYLAQHDFLSQIPPLRRDIAVPDYCHAVDRGLDTDSQTGENVQDGDDSDGDPALDRVVLLNTWLGPVGTVSPAHTDPHHNIFAQVAGHKYFRVFPPDAAGMYPRSADEGGINISNTSGVDVGAFVARAKAHDELQDPDAARKWPLHAARRDYCEAVLGPGDVLFLPRGWWHYVEAMGDQTAPGGGGICASVSFWW